VLAQGLNIKRYPVCYAIHRGADAALSLHPQVAQRLEAIDEVVVTLGQLQADMLRAHRPVTGLDAKFSAQYTLACALARGHVDLADLRDPAVNDPIVQTLLRKVRVMPVQERDHQEPLFSPQDELLIRMADGTHLKAEPVRRALGHASRPVSDSHLQQKFMACAQISLDAAGAQDWWDAAMAAADSRVAWPGDCPTS
jgi:2-methylcitrate dehydratase PrpD